MAKKKYKVGGRPSKSGKDQALLKKEFLARLAEGRSVYEIARLLNISRNTPYYWTKKDPEFKAEMDRIREDPLYSTQLLSENTKEELGISDNWKLRFLGMYRRTGDRNASLQTVGEGKTAQDVENALNPTHEEYDESFAEMFAAEEQKRLWKIEDNTLKKAEFDAPTARFVLSNLMKDKYGKLGENSVTVNQVWFNSKGEALAIEKLRDLNFGRRTEPGPERQVEHGRSSDSSTKRLPEQASDSA